jgi:hypothetical protein
VNHLSDNARPPIPTPLSFVSYQARVPVVKTMGVVSGVGMRARQA